eukprot:6465712-Amphidinium_carterae.1
MSEHNMRVQPSGGGCCRSTLRLSDLANSVQSPPCPTTGNIDLEAVDDRVLNVRTLTVKVRLSSASFCAGVSVGGELVSLRFCSLRSCSGPSFQQLVESDEISRAGVSARVSLVARTDVAASSSSV